MSSKWKEKLHYTLFHQANNYIIMVSLIDMQSETLSLTKKSIFILLSDIGTPKT